MAFGSEYDKFCSVRLIAYTDTLYSTLYADSLSIQVNIRPLQSEKFPDTHTRVEGYNNSQLSQIHISEQRRFQAVLLIFVVEVKFVLFFLWQFYIGNRIDTTVCPRCIPRHIFENDDKIGDILVRKPLIPLFNNEIINLAR